MEEPSGHVWTKERKPWQCPGDSKIPQVMDTKGFHCILNLHFAFLAILGLSLESSQKILSSASQFWLVCGTKTSKISRLVTGVKTHFWGNPGKKYEKQGTH